MSSNVEGFTNRKIINQQAAEWVLLLEETPKLSAEQISALNDWVSTSDVHRECLESMASSWDELDLLSEVMLPQEMKQQSLFSMAVSSLVFAYSMLVSLLKHLIRPIVAAPAALAIVAWLSFSLLNTDELGTANEYYTLVGESSRHTMPDGSTIWLNSNSRVQVQYDDDYRRINLLSGEAHFDVAKDPNRPFEVYADNRLIKAIGTAFSVHKLSDSVEVLVTEGTVELAIVDNALVLVPDDFKPVKIAASVDSSNDISAAETGTIDADQEPKVKKHLATLTAGQRISIPVEEENVGNVVDLDSSEMTRFLSWREGKLIFAGESLEQVIEEISRHTEVNIEVIDPTLKSIRIGGQFQVGETDSLFYVLESGFGIKVDRITDQHVKLSVKE